MLPKFNKKDSTSNTLRTRSALWHLGKSCSISKRRLQESQGQITFQVPDLDSLEARIGLHLSSKKTLIPRLLAYQRSVYPSATPNKSLQQLLFKMKTTTSLKS